MDSDTEIEEHKEYRVVAMSYRRRTHLFRFCKPKADNRKLPEQQTTLQCHWHALAPLTDFGA